MAGYADICITCHMPIVYFNPQSRLIVSSSLAYLNITSSLKMELSLSLSLYRVFIINIAYLIDCLILIKGNTIIMTDYVSIVRNADIFTKSYKSNISESQKSAFLKYRHMVYRMFFQIIKILSEVRH